MNISSRIRVAFATFALATTVVTAMMNPLSVLAAQNTPNQPTPNMPHPTPTPAHRFDPKPPLADVSVKTVGHSGSNQPGDFLVVAFNLKTVNIDAGINLTSDCTYRKLWDTSQIRHEQHTSSMKLLASWPVPTPFDVTCVPSYDEFVSAVYLKADVPAGDVNTANNIDTWDHITNK